MTESVTVPAHIENGELLLDAPLPKGAVSVEVRVEVKAPDAAKVSVTEFLKALPAGTRSAKEIDEDLRDAR